MFDLNNIEFIGGKYSLPGVNRDRIHYSFVGIKRNEESGKLQFWLPLGFDQFDNRDFDTVKRFFFSMYKTFKLYISRRKHELNEEEIDNQRDGIHEKQGGFSFGIEDKEEVVLYSKLNSIDKILEGYDELKISSLAKKIHTSAEIDYSKIYKYLHKAIYLENDVAFLDEVQLKKPIIRPDHPPIVQLFCFIYTELKSELEELDTVSSLAFDLANEFKETYLNLESSLFDQDTFQDTIIQLKDILEESFNHTAYKDEDFWHFYEAVEAFLYGENDFDDIDDIYWGISNFYDAWEDLCQYYMLNAYHPFKDKILYADIKGVLDDRFNLQPEPFKLSLDAAGKPREIRPDLVYFQFPKGQNNKSFSEIFHIETFDNNRYVTIELIDESYKELYFTFWKLLIDSKRFNRKKITIPKHSNRIRYGILDQATSKIKRRLSEFQQGYSKIRLKVIDYKYMSELAFHEYSQYTLNEDGRNKIQNDIKKQLIYEWTLQKNFSNVRNFRYPFDGLSTKSEFWIPYYNSKEDSFLTTKTVPIQNTEFNKSRIRVIKINFQTLQKFYIQDDQTYSS